MATQPAAYDFDAFISYAREDADVVATLQQHLEREGLRVWIDRSIIGDGDSVVPAIERGLARSKYGIVLLSERYLAKPWPRKELATILHLATDGGPVVLPVLHGISAKTLRAESPFLADSPTFDTAEGADELARKLAHAIQNGQPRIITVSASGETGLTTIGDALTVSAPGTVIRIARGVYREQLVIEKRVSLMGDEDGAVVIESIGTPAVVVKSGGVELEKIRLVRHDDHRMADLVRPEVLEPLLSGVQMDDLRSLILELSELHDVALLIDGGDCALTLCSITAENAAGVLVRGSLGKALLRRCTITDCAVGAVMTTVGSEAVVEESTMVRTLSSAVWALGGTVVLRATTIREAATGLLGIDGVATIEECTITSASVGAAFVGGRTTLRACHFDRCLTSFSTHSNAMVESNGCRYTDGTLSGLQLKGTSRVVDRNGTYERNAVHVMTFGQSRLELHAAKFHGGRISIDGDEQSTLALYGCEFENLYFAIGGNRECTGEIVDCRMSQLTGGAVTLQTTKPFTVARCTMSRLPVAVRATSVEKLQINQCRVDQCNGAFELKDLGEVTIFGTHVTDAEFGVGLRNGSLLVMESTFTQCRTAGVAIEIGNLRITRTNVKESGGGIVVMAGRVHIGEDLQVFANERFNWIIMPAAEITGGISDEERRALTEALARHNYDQADAISIACIRRIARQTVFNTDDKVDQIGDGVLYLLDRLWRQSGTELTTRRWIYRGRDDINPRRGFFSSPPITERLLRLQHADKMYG